MRESVDRGSAPAYLPSVDEVAALASEEKARLRGHLLVLLAASLTEPTAPFDRPLSPTEAAGTLGRSVDWVRRNAPEWHAKLVREFGIGFIMQPVDNGDIRYSADGIELLKRYWRGARAPR